MVGEITGFLHIVRIEAPIDPIPLLPSTASRSRRWVVGFVVVMSRSKDSTGSQHFSDRRTSRLRKSSERGGRSPRGGSTRSHVWGSRQPRSRRSGSRQERPRRVRSVTRAAVSGAGGTRTRRRHRHTSVVASRAPRLAARKPARSHTDAHWNAACCVGCHGHRAPGLHGEPAARGRGWLSR